MESRYFLFIFLLILLFILYLGRNEVIRREKEGEDVIGKKYQEYYEKYSYRYGNNIENFNSKNRKNKTNTKSVDVLEIDEEEDKKNEKNREGWHVLNPVEDVNAAIAWSIWFFELMLYFISFMECGFIMLMNIWVCFKWYFLNMILVIIYFPFSILFYLTGTTDIEDDFWNFIYYIDGLIYSNFDFHVAHFPDSVISECYTCALKEFPELPSDYMSLEL